MEDETFKKSDPDEFSCKLIVDTENDSPQVLTDILGIDATGYKIKGSQRYNPKTMKSIDGVYEENNLWIYETEKKYGKPGLYLNQSITDMLKFLDDRKELFLMIFKKYQKNQLFCYPYFYDFHTYFILDKELIARLSYYNIDIVFDMYYFS